MHELTPFPDQEKIIVKPKFEERYRALLGDRYDEFMRYSLSFLRRSIRVNTLKTTVEDVESRLSPKWKLVPVPWCKEGFWISSERRDVGNLAEHSLGYIYVQEAASMIPPIVLDPKPGDVVLDLCASPGSKTSQMGMYMENKGLLIANDIKANRLKPLGLNLQRTGISNSMITLSMGQSMRTNLKFDKILVDAPCTGTGTIRKSLKTLLMWNPAMIRKISKMQRKILGHAYSLLKPGGTIVYSTCTLEPEEDEEVVSWLLETHDDAYTEEIELNINRSAPITEFGDKKYSKGVKHCLRIYPQDNDTEGFFVTKIKKKPLEEKAD